MLLRKLILLDAAPRWRTRPGAAVRVCSFAAALISVALPLSASAAPQQAPATAPQPTVEPAAAATSPAAATPASVTPPAAATPAADVNPAPAATSVVPPAPGTAPVPTQAPATPTDAASTTLAAPVKTYTVPAGTKLLLTLQSPINTKSTKAGDGVYLQSAFPVIVGNRVLIPAGMYVQGTVDSVERHVRIKGHAKLNMHFTSMIFPNGTVIEVPGTVSGIPGSTGPKVKGSEGTVEQSGGAGDVAKAAGKGAERGATGGVIVGAIESHPFEGAGYGAAAGAVIGAAVSLFTHGNDISILAGSQVEMVLQRDLILQESNLADAASGPTFVPTAQRQPMQKPNSRRILCPGGSACQ